MVNNEYVSLLQKNYDKLMNYKSWTADKRILLMIASHYSAAGRTFSSTTFDAIIGEFKQQTSWLSTLRTNPHLLNCIAMMLEEKKEDTSIIVKQFLEDEQILKDAKFKRSPYSYISAIFLNDNKEQKVIHAKRAKDLYDAIRKQHPFLTSHEDIPYSVLLSQVDGDPQIQAETMNRYYTELRKYHFPMGDHLQWLSQIMTFKSPTYIEQLVPYVVQIRDELQKREVKIKKEHFPLLGFLAVAGVKTEQMDQFVELYQELLKMKIFRWYKQMAFSVAIQKVLHDLADLTDPLDMTVVTHLQMLIQAEQAVMLATTMAVVASSTETTE